MSRLSSHAHAHTHVHTSRVNETLLLHSTSKFFCLRLFLAEATVELSLDSPQEKRKRDVAAKPTASASAAVPASSLSAAAAAGPSKPQPAAALEEVISFPTVLSYKTSVILHGDWKRNKTLLSKLFTFSETTFFEHFFFPDSLFYFEKLRNYSSAQNAM